MYFKPNEVILLLYRKSKYSNSGKYFFLSANKKLSLRTNSSLKFYFYKINLFNPIAFIKNYSIDFKVSSS